MLYNYLHNQSVKVNKASFDIKKQAKSIECKNSIGKKLTKNCFMPIYIFLKLWDFDGATKQI